MGLRFAFHAFALLIVAVLALPVRAGSAPIELTSTSSGALINAQVDYFVDRTQQMTIEQVEKDADFVSTHGATGLGIQDSPVWLRMVLQRHADAPVNWQLEFGAFNPDLVQIYVADGKGGFATQVSGESLPFATRPFPYSQYLYAITLTDTQPVTIYLRTFKPSGAQNIPLRVWQFAHWAERELLEYLLYGLCTGVMGGLALYNLLLFIRLRERIFLWYFLVVSTYILFTLNAVGLGNHVLWPDWFYRLPARTPLLGSLWAICSIPFSLALFDGPDVKPWVRRLLYGCCVIYALNIAGILLGYRSHASTVVTVLPIAWYPLMIGLAVYRAWRHSLPAIYFLAGFGPVLVGVAFLILAGKGVMPATSWVTTFFLVAGAWEAVLFSQALAERVNQLKREREAAERRRREVEYAQAEIERKRTYTDELTGLANREFLRREGDAWLRRKIEPLVLVLNIDRFKAINDALGYAVGDAVLIEVGQRLAALPDIIVGRLHANQFCVIAQRADQLDDLRLWISLTFREPLSVNGQSVDVSLSVGVVAAAAPEADMARRMRNAEIALHAGRRNYTGWTHYADDMESERRTDLALLSALRRAVENNELRLYLQPKVCMADGKVNSAEALVRWQHPERGMVPPGDFIPFAEQTGSIGHLTRWVIHEAMRLTRIRRDTAEAMQISVNLSVHDLRDPGFVDEMRIQLATSGANPADIRLEITESVVMDDPTVMLDVMRALNALGFSLSVDDFGTGYSSLAYLQKMPVTELKIDRAFVAGTRVGGDAEALLDSIIGLGHRLGLSVVAEGAETIEEWNLLRSLGCDYLQGWVVAKAMPVVEFEHWVATHTPFDLARRDR